MFQDLLSQAAGSTPRVALPSAYYSSEGDCVFAFLEAVPYERERVDHLLTLFRAPGDRRIVGLQIKAITRLPDCQIAVPLQDGAVTEAHGRQPDTVSLLLLTFSRDQSVTYPNRVGMYTEAARAMSQHASHVEGLQFS